MREGGREEEGKLFLFPGKPPPFLLLPLKRRFSAAKKDPSSLFRWVERSDEKKKGRLFDANSRLIKKKKNLYKKGSK